MTQSPDTNQIKKLYHGALDLFDGNDFAGAYRTLKELQSQFPGAVEAGFVDMHIGHCCFYLAYENSSKWDEGLMHLEQAYAEIDRKAYGLEFITICDLLGGTLWFLERNEEASKYLIEGLDYLHEYNEDCAAYYLIQLGKVHLYLQKYSRALDYLQRASDFVSKAEGRMKLESELNFELGRVYFQLEDQETAITALRKVDPDLLAAVNRSYFYHALLRVHCASRNFSEALHSFQALQKEGVGDGAAESYWLAGFASYHLHRPKQALEWFRKSDSYPTSQEWIRQKSQEYVKRIASENPELGGGSD